MRVGRVFDSFLSSLFLVAFGLDVKECIGGLRGLTRIFLWAVIYQDLYGLVLPSIQLLTFHI